MGERTVAQEALFYSFNLERHVPADHLLRSIDRFVDLSDKVGTLEPTDKWVKPYYAVTNAKRHKREMFFTDPAAAWSDTAAAGNNMFKGEPKVPQI